MKFVIWKMVFIAILFPHLSAAQDTLTMVYRTTAKEPFIGAAPNHEGIWLRVYEKAAQKIGLTLKVERLPKKRAYLELAKGAVDFYPAASFSQERADFGFYINNQYEQEGILIIHNKNDEINSVDDIVNFELLVNLGNTTRFYTDSEINLDQNRIDYVGELDVSRAVSIVRERNRTVYAYTDISIQKYLSNKQISDIQTLEVDFKKETSYLLFSRNSRFYQEKPNPDFDPQQDLSIDNLPYMLDETSVAYRFQEALEELKQSGEFDELARIQTP